jgi:hypothetical protein
MQDMDVGEMFLNFQLHPNTMRIAAVDNKFGYRTEMVDRNPH